MQLYPRLIPILLVNKNGLYKTVGFGNPKYIGDPLNAIRIFNAKKVDEIIVLDYRASLDRTLPDMNLAKEMAEEAFMPMAFGGGIHTIDQAQKLFDLGIEKVVLNTSFYQKPDLIGEIAKRFGSQSVIVSLDIKKNWLGNIKLYSKSGTNSEKDSLTDALIRAANLGAGEILIQSIESDGKFSGLAIDILKTVQGKVNIPIVIAGGARHADELASAVEHGASAIAAGSIFVYKNNNTNSILINYPDEADLEKIYEKIGV